MAVEKTGISDDGELQSTITVSGKTFNDIQNAVDKAKANDVIQLTGTYTGSEGSIYVDKSLTIQGDSNYAILDAQETSSIVNCALGAKITLKNIIFKNSLYFAVLANSDCSVDNCKFENNQYGISCSDSSESHNLIVKNSDFNNNGIAIDAQVKSLTVEKSTFTNNKDNAIYINSLESTAISVKDSTFSGNTAETGAAILAYLNKGTATISNCNFNKNTATYSAGAVMISGNETFQLNILGSTFDSNSGKADASALDLINVKSTVKNNIFIKNTASNELFKSVGYLEPFSILDNNIIKDNVASNENLKLEFLSTPVYYGDVFEVKFTKDGSALSNKKITLLAFEQGYIYFDKLEGVTDTNGVAKFAFTSDLRDYAGIWDIQAIADSGNSKLLVSKNSINVKQLNAQIISNDLTTTYASGKVFSFKVNNKNTNEISSGVKLYVSVYKNGYYFKEYTLKSNINGVATIKIANFASGNYVAYIESHDTLENVKLDKTSFKIKINKAPTKVSAPKVTNKYKKSKYFKVTVKAYNKAVNKLKVKVKVFTGKKSKTYTITTNSKGVAQLNTKSLSKGTHKVEISSGNANYKISAKSTIKIS